MLSKKSFRGNKRNFLKLLMRFVRSDVRDHIASQKNDHDLRIDTKEHRNGEIFGVVRFSGRAFLCSRAPRQTLQSNRSGPAILADYYKSNDTFGRRR